MKKTEAKKPVVNKIVQNCEQHGLSMTYHMVLMWVELFLIVRNVLNLATSFMNPLTWQRTADQVFYVAMLVCMIIAVVRHDHKSGAASLLIYILLELGLTLLVWYVAVSKGLQIEGLDTKMFSMLIGPVVWFIPTLIYYRKRWSFLA